MEYRRSAFPSVVAGRKRIIRSPLLCQVTSTPAEPNPRANSEHTRPDRSRDSKHQLTKFLTQEDDFVRRPAVRLFIPDSLKSILVDDWEKVTKDQKLAPVPSPTPVTKFLNEYYAAEAVHRRPQSADADILEEVVAGVKEYFNKSLGRILLYRFERQQYYEIHKQVEAGHGEHAGDTLADVYGCEHLLRLFGECH
jgi:mortality factor 4-like protein 1